MALPELLGIAIEPAQRFVDVPEETAFLAGEKECLLALHCVGSLIGHVEGVGAQVAIGALWRRSESLVLMAQLLEDALSLLEQALLEMLKALLGHCLYFFAAGCCCHFLTYPLQGDFDVLPIKVERVCRVFSFDFLAQNYPDGEHFSGDPLLKSPNRFLNLFPGSHH